MQRTVCAVQRKPRRTSSSQRSRYVSQSSVSREKLATRPNSEDRKLDERTLARGNLHSATATHLSPETVPNLTGLSDADEINKAPGKDESVNANRPSFFWELLPA